MKKIITLFAIATFTPFHCSKAQTPAQKPLADKSADTAEDSKVEFEFKQIIEYQEGSAGPNALKVITRCLKNKKNGFSINHVYTTTSRNNEFVSRDVDYLDKAKDNPQEARFMWQILEKEISNNPEQNLTKTIIVDRDPKIKAEKR